LKSLRYVRGGRPRRLDDCLDLARSRPLAKVTLDLRTDELVTELRILRQFVGTYEWHFGHRTIRCEEVYGCSFLPAAEDAQISSIAAANARLRRRLEEIQRRGIEVNGADRRFEDSECLCGRR